MESKTTTESSDRRFALLIDADNGSACYLKPILNELSKKGILHADFLPLARAGRRDGIGRRQLRRGSLGLDGSDEGL